MTAPWTLRLAIWLLALTVGPAVVLSAMLFVTRVRIGLEIGDVVVGLVVGAAMASYAALLVAVFCGSRAARLLLTLVAVIVTGGLLALSAQACGAFLLAGVPSLVSTALMWTPRANAFVRERSAAV